VKIYDIEKHTSCYCYDRKEAPIVDLVEIEQDIVSEIFLSTNEIIFVIAGKLSITLRNNQCGEVRKGDVLFLPAGESLQYKTLKSSEILILRLTDSINLCYNFSLEQLYNEMKRKEKPDGLFPLKANTRLLHFTKGLIDSWKDGFRCRSYLRTEISKLLTMLPIYYSKSELYCFYYPVLSPDATFSEYVRTNHLKYRTINELATSMNLSPQQFTRRFNAIYGQNPHDWIQRERARLIYGEICQSHKPLKEIASEYGFSDQANFNRFCKTFFEMTPGEIRQKKA